MLSPIWIRTDSDIPPVVSAAISLTRDTGYFDGFPSGFHMSAFSPDGTKLAVADGVDDWMYVFDTSDWTVLEDSIDLFEYGTANISWTPDGAYILAIFGSAPEGESHLMVIDASTYLPVTPPFVSNPSSIAKPVASVNATAGGIIAVSTASNGSFFRLDNRAFIGSIAIGNSNCIAFSPDGQFFASSQTASPYVKVFDPSDRTLITSFASLGEDYEIAFSPDSSHMALVKHQFGSSDNLKVFRTSDWTEVTVTDQMPWQSNSLQYTDDGLYLYIVANDGDFFYAFDTTDYSLVPSSFNTPPGSGAQFASFSNDGLRVLYNITGGYYYNISFNAATATPEGFLVSLGLGIVSAKVANTVLIDGQQVDLELGVLPAIGAANILANGFEFGIEIGQAIAYQGSLANAIGVSAQVLLGSPSVITESGIMVSGVSANIILGDVEVFVPRRIQISGLGVSIQLGSEIVITNSVIQISGLEIGILLGNPITTAGISELISGFQLDLSLGSVTPIPSNIQRIDGVSCNAIVGSVSCWGILSEQDTIWS